MILLLASGSVLILYSWREYERFHDEQAYNRELVAVANQPGATNDQRQQAEGKDETKDDSHLDSYQTNPSDPRAIYIDTLHIKARTLPMTIHSNGAMQAPINIYDAGWYTGASRPGEQGAVVVVGHASGPTREGLFAYIDTLNMGDVVRVERGDGNQFWYKVIEKKTVALDLVDMTELLKPHEGSEGLNMMTCGGSWNAKRKTYMQRIMVFTRRIQ